MIASKATPMPIAAILSLRDNFLLIVLALFLAAAANNNQFEGEREGIPFALVTIQVQCP